jgi:hypothetical protein
VELALALPLLCILLFGMIELGFMIKSKMVLQDAVREAASYGALAGNFTGVVNPPNSATAEGCLADYSILSDIAARLQNSVIDTTRVRSVFIYAATNTDNNPRVAPSSTGLSPSLPQTYPISSTVALNGDYYYANYSTSNGADVDSSSQNTGTGDGAIYKLFHNNINGIFNNYTTTYSLFLTYPPDVNNPNGYVPDCGSSIAQTGQDTSGHTINCFPYDDSHSSGGQAGPAFNTTSCLKSDSYGNWPPEWRNNATDENTAEDTTWPDYIGVDIVYDYQFHTPLFWAISSFLTGGTHTFRMDEHAVFIMDPVV